MRDREKNNRNKKERNRRQGESMIGFIPEDPVAGLERALLWSHRAFTRIPTRVQHDRLVQPWDHTHARFHIHDCDVAGKMLPYALKIKNRPATVL